MECERQFPPSPGSTQGLPGGSIAQSHGPSLVELLSHSLSPRGARHPPLSTQDRSQFNALRYRATLLDILSDAIVIAEEEGVGHPGIHLSNLRDASNGAARVNHPAGEPPTPLLISGSAGARYPPNVRRRGKKHDEGDAHRPTQ